VAVDELQKSEAAGAQPDGATAIDPATYYGEPLVDECEILSPGPQGSEVFNPIVVAEFRRWKARPFTYLAMVVVIALSITAMTLVRTNILRGAGATFTIFGFDVVGFLQRPTLGLAGAPSWQLFFYYLVPLIIRPSTILPLMMVWRALVSFRAGGLYRSFRMTFLTPGDFLWGIVAVPFFVSALILILYTGLVLAPGLIEGVLIMPPERQVPTHWARVAGILYEGSLNGMLICFVALYIGLRGGARLSALGPVLLATLAIEGLHAWGYVHQMKVMDLLGTVNPLYSPWISACWQYVAMGTPKLFACVALWMLCKRLIRRQQER